MKKTVILMLVLMLILAACARGTEESSSTTTAPTTVATEPSTRVTTAPPTRPAVEVPVVEEAPEVENPLFVATDCTELFGQWQLDVTISSNYMNLPDFTGSVTFPVIWTFGSDGRFTMELNGAYAKAIVDYETMLADFMIEGYYNKFVAEKKISVLTDKQIQERWEEYGLSNAQTQTHSYLDELALSTAFLELARSGYYYVEDDVLYLSVTSDPMDEEDYESFQFDFDEEGLVLSNSSRIRFYSNMCVRFPVALKDKIA